MGKRNILIYIAISRLPESMEGIDIPFDLSDFLPGTHPERITLGKYYQQFD